MTNNRIRYTIDPSNLPTTYQEASDMLELVDAEILSITAQLTDYHDAAEDSLDDDDHDWAKRAENARYAKYKIAAKLKRIIRETNDERKIAIVSAKAEAEKRKLERRALAAENLRAAQQIAQRSQEARLKRIEASRSKDGEKLKAVMAHLKKNHKSAWGEVVSILQGIDDEATNDD